MNDSEAIVHLFHVFREGVEIRARISSIQNRFKRKKFLEFFSTEFLLPVKNLVGAPLIFYCQLTTWWSKTADQKEEICPQISTSHFFIKFQQLFYRYSIIIKTKPFLGSGSRKFMGVKFVGEFRRQVRVERVL